jgi:hypothetical protein
MIRPRTNGYLFVNVARAKGTDLMPIESGRTRCPRCAAWTDYLFLERGDNKLEYKVRCSACGNVHSEITVLATATTAAA